MNKEEAIKYLQQLYPNGGHCWLDEQRIEAIGMAVKALQEESVSVWHDIEELSMAREYEYILVIYKDTTSPRVAGNKTQVSYWDRVDKWAYIDDLLKF